MRLLGRPAALAVVARLARRHEVLPRVAAAAVAREHVVEGEVVRLPAAVLAGVAVAAEDLAPGELDARPRPADVVLEPDDRRGAVDLPDRADLGVVVLDDLGLGPEHEAERPRDVADVQGLVVLVQDEHDPVHRPNDSSTARGVGFGGPGGRERGRGEGAGGRLPSDPGRVHRPLDAGDLDFDPADLGGGLLPLVAAQLRGVAPAARGGVLLEQRLAGGGGRVPRLAVPVVSAMDPPCVCGASVTRVARASAPSLSARLSARGPPARPSRARPGPRAGRGRTSAHPRAGPCG